MAVQWFHTTKALAGMLNTTPGALRIKLCRAKISADRMVKEEGKWKGEYSEATVKQIKALYEKPRKAGRPGGSK